MTKSTNKIMAMEIIQMIQEIPKLIFFWNNEDSGDEKESDDNTDKTFH